MSHIGSLSWQVSHGIYWSCTLGELLLLAKAVVVAVLGEEAVLPPPPPPQGASGDVGLLCMYTAIVAALLCSFAENALALRLVASWRKTHETAEEARAVSGGASCSNAGASSMQQPLLSKKGKAAEVGKVGMWGRVIQGGGHADSAEAAHAAVGSARAGLASWQVVSANPNPTATAAYVTP